MSNEIRARAYLAKLLPAMAEQTVTPYTPPALLAYGVESFCRQLDTRQQIKPGKIITP